MKFFKLIALLLFVLVFPMFLGNPFGRRSEKSDFRLIRTWCMGWIAQYAVLFPLALAGIFLRWSTRFLSILFLLVMIGLSIWSLIGMVRRRDHLFNGGRSALKRTTFLGWLALILVLGHALFTFVTVHVDDDDVSYIGAVTTSVDTDTLMQYDAQTGDPITDLSWNDMDRLVTAPQFAWYASVSVLTGIRPAPLAHTFLPPFFTMLMFGAFALCGEVLFDGNRRKTDGFCFLVFFICAFSAVSIYTAGDFIMVRSWQGKAQVAGLIMPLVLGCLLRREASRRGRWMQGAELLLILSAGCFLTSMGGLLASILAAAMIFVRIIREKSIRLILPALPAFAVPVASMIIYIII